MRILIVVADTSYRGEYSMALQALHEAKCEVTTGILDDRVNVNHQLDLRRDNVGEYDSVLVVGGYGLYYGITGKKSPGRVIVPTEGQLSILGSLLSNAVKHGSTVIAPLVVPAYMARLGLLRGRRATVYPLSDLLRMLVDGGAEFVNEPVVVDGNVVTMKRLTVSNILGVLKG
jgi:putative intracellular protease/amidase